MCLFCGRGQSCLKDRPIFRYYLASRLGGRKKSSLRLRNGIFSFIPSSLGARYKCLIIEIDLCGLSHVLGKGNRMNRPFSWWRKIMRMKNHFHIKGKTLNLVLTQRPRVARTWPICVRRGTNMKDSGPKGGRGATPICGLNRYVSQ